MNKVHVLMLCLFVGALGTGVVVGMGVSHGPKFQDRDSWLADELNLTSSQSTQIKAIWSEMIGGPGPSRDRRHEFQKERDDAIFALIPESQQLSYNKIVEHYNQEITDLNKERDAAFQSAVERTKAILTDYQRAKYDELLKKGFHGRSGSPGTRDRQGPATASAPATQSSLK